MFKLQSSVASICAALLLLPSAYGQQPVAGAQTPPTIPTPGPGMGQTAPPDLISSVPGEGLVQPYNGKFSSVAKNYLPPHVKQISLANSSRLDELIRAGRIYLSLQDAIALALENNLDIEISRYNMPIAQSDVLRAQAGGLLRGVPSSIQQGRKFGGQPADRAEFGKWHLERRQSEALPPVRPAAPSSLRPARPRPTTTRSCSSPTTGAITVFRRPTPSTPVFQRWSSTAASSSGAYSRVGLRAPS